MATIRDTYELLGVDKTQRAFKSAQSSADRLTAAFRTMGVALAAGTAGAGAIAKIALDAAKTADQMQKLTDRLGGTVEGFSTLRVAAQLSGVEFNQAATGVQRMTRRLAQAADGTGEAVEAFDTLGLSAEKLVELPIEQQLAAVADALKEVENDSRRVALAQKIFDSEAVKLLQTLKDGSIGLQEYAAIAAKTGAIVDDQLADSSVRANDGLTRLRLAGEGFANGLARQVLPVIGAFSEVLAEGVTAGANAAGEAIRQLSAFVINAVAGMFDAISGLQSGAARAAEFLGLEGAATGLREASRAFDDVAESTREWADFTVTATKVTIDAQAAMEKYKVDLEAVQGRTLKNTEAQKGQNAALKEQAKIQRELEREREKALRAEAERLAEVEALVRSLRTPQEVLNDSFLRYNDLLNTGRISQETYNRAIERAQDSFDKTREKIAETSNEMSNFADEAGRNIQDSLANFLFDPFQDGLDGMLDGFTNMLRRMAAEAAASQILESFGGSSAIGGLLGNVFGARATGGGAPAGAAMLVGENGPEVFVPSQNGRIVPGNQAGGGGNITVNIQAGAQVTRQTANQLAAQIGAKVNRAQGRLS